MDAYLDGLLDELVKAEPREAWGAVLDRARRTRRRYIAVVAVVSALVLVPATWAAVNAFQGTPAPQSIVQNFVQWNAEAPNLAFVNPQTGFERHVPLADATKAHGVVQLDTSDGPLDMWAAPESDGSGSCWFVAWESDIHGDTPAGSGGCTQGDQAAIAPATVSFASHGAYTILDGSVTGPETTLDVTLTDGSTTTLPVVEHLFLAALPHGSNPASIVGRDANGTVVATFPEPNP